MRGHSTRAGGGLIACTFVFGALLLAGTAGAQSSTTTASKTTSPDAWASGVCSAVDTWLDSIDSTFTSLKGAGSVDAAANQAKAGKDVGEAAKDVQNTATTLKGLKPNGELRNAFKNSSSRQDLKDKR